MKKYLVPVLAAILSTPLLGATPAQAAVSVASLSLSPTTAIINGDAGCSYAITVTAKVYDPVADPDQVTDVYATAYDPSGYWVDNIYLRYVSDSGDYLYFNRTLYLCGYDDPGSYKLVTEVNWQDATGADQPAITHTSSFSVKRPTSLTYNASPEPAKKGSYLTHSGRLMFDPYAPGSMYGASGITLTIAFKQAGTASYLTKGTVVTGAGGYYSKKLQTWADGTWRITYPGTSARQSQVKTDYVDTY
jgi:hypothetical protein